MRSRELSIEISPDGKVRAETHGMKGASCLKLAELLEAIVGRMESLAAKAESFEPENEVAIAAGVGQRAGRS